MHKKQECETPKRDHRDTHIDLLNEAINQLNKEIKEAHKYLNSLRIPTNGLDAEGKLGYGKREELSLKQRLSFVCKK